MVPKSLCLLLALATTLSAQACPKFVCTVSLGRNICANRLTSMSYQLNNEGCEEDFYCTAAGVMTWVGMSVTTSTYHCTRVPDLSNTPTTPTYVAQICPARQSDKDFRSGVTVVTCQSDSDCILRDDTFTTCDCVFRNDGAGICTPDINNMSIFQGFWDECGTSNTITSESAYAYWSYYQSMYTLMQSGLPCIDIFQEVQELSSLSGDYNSAAGLALAAWVALG